MDETCTFSDTKIEVYNRCIDSLSNGYYLFEELWIERIPSQLIHFVTDAINKFSSIELTTVEYVIHLIFSVLSLAALFFILVVYLWLHFLHKKMKDTPLTPLKVMIPEQGFCNPTCTENHNHTFIK